MNSKDCSKKPLSEREIERRHRQRLMSRNDIEMEYGLSRRWLELAALRGDGPPITKISRRMVRYRCGSFEDWLASRTETVEHPFGTIKMRMGATHFLMKRLKNVKTEMALSVLAYNLTRVMNIIGIKPLMAAVRA